jgi:dsRNA-specific ribonuclease
MANMTQLDLSKLPPLPPIDDPKLKSLVLTHKSTQAIKGKIDNYEKLAHVGDALLGKY